MTSADHIPPPARSALEVWLRHHDERVPGFVEGLYLIGSIALGNWRAESDIDIVAVSGRVADTNDVDALRAVNEAINAEVPGPDIDGPFVTWADLARPPTAAVRPWTLHREFHHDADCFELNPAIWQTLSRHGIAVRGPSPSELDIHVDHRALRSFISENTSGYWRSIPPSIDAALADPERVEFSAGITSWSVLGIGRMLYTARTGEVTSKSDAGRWLIGELPHHRDLITHALRVRDLGECQPDGRETARATAAFVTEVADLIEAETS
ncbi:MAG: aminoglycoside adenylyltransferase domain-containing protein [Actinomycetota bacterium]